MYYFSSSARSKHYIVLIDTPGYGDTRGIEQDKRIDYMIGQTITNNLHKVDMLALVRKSSTIRFTTTQSYIAQKVGSLASIKPIGRDDFLFLHVL